MEDEYSHLIVGAGVFGVSTALYLVRTDPSAKVVLIDSAAFPNPSSASSDLNKIIRADYPDEFHMSLALEALDEWRTNRLYSPFYHETGMLFADEIGMGQCAFRNYKSLGVDTGAHMLSMEEARTKFPVFEHANWTDVPSFLFQPKAGWGAADPALKAGTQAAIDAGVQYVQAEVKSLLFNEAGDCIGVNTVRLGSVLAQNILLCTGARTAQFLADSAPEREDLQVNGRMVAAAATSCIVTCDPKCLYLYQQAPVHFLGMSHTHGESIPPGPDGRLKFNFEVSFTNKVFHEASGQLISVPPSQFGQKTWSQDVPVELKESVERVVQHVYGDDAPGLSVESYRMCWDAVTPNQNWIISPHPACKQLYVAGGGSFHSWKFFPTLGKYVARMMKGELSQDQAKRWAWDRENEGAACEMYIPQKDLKDWRGYDELPNGNL
jgi:sarcosine oxidase/L-pipecolate oxidase